MLKKTEHAAKPFLSVIVPSYNRENEIDELLESLEQQVLPKDEFEVLIVDDGSTDQTEKYIQSYIDRKKLHITFIKQNHLGPGQARNNGMEHAHGEVFVFIDSDCIAPPGWLEKIKNQFISEPDTAAFGGRDGASKSFSSLLKAINYSMTSFITTGGMRGGKKKRLAKFYPRSFNMGLRRTLYKQIGGFGHLRHGQDIEFSNRMIKSGAKVAYISDAIVYHKRRTSLRKFFKQVYNWGVARINLYKIDPAMLEPLHFLPAMGFWFAVLVTLFAVFVPVILLLWEIMAALTAILLFFSAIDAAIQMKSVKTGFLTPIVMILQVTGYGLGFTAAYLWRVVLGKKEFTGFVKRYYH